MQILYRLFLVMAVVAALASAAIYQGMSGQNDGTRRIGAKYAPTRAVVVPGFRMPVLDADAGPVRKGK